MVVVVACCSYIQSLCSSDTWLRLPSQHNFCRWTSITSPLDTQEKIRVAPFVAVSDNVFSSLFFFAHDRCSQKGNISVHWSQTDEIGIGEYSGCFNQIGRLLTQTGLDRFLIFRHTLSVRHLEDLQNVPRPWKRTGVLCLGVGLI